MRWWKVAGAAAFLGVAATGVVIVRSERRRRAYTPDQVRDRLRARAASAVTDPLDSDSAPAAVQTRSENPRLEGPRFEKAPEVFRKFRKAAFELLRNQRSTGRRHSNRFPS